VDQFLGGPVASLFSSATCLEKEPLEIIGTGHFLSLSQVSRVLKRTQTTEDNQGNLPLIPGVCAGAVSNWVSV